MEIEANRFAAELLMPNFLIEPALSEAVFDVDDDRLTSSLASKYKVSKSAMGHRISAMLNTFS